MDKTKVGENPRLFCHIMNNHFQTVYTYFSEVVIKVDDPAFVCLGHEMIYRLTFLGH